MRETRVKICGITNREDALAAVHYGADFIGLIFYPRSPRAVDAGAAAEIVAALQTRSSIGEIPANSEGKEPAVANARPRTVGVFVNETVAQILEIQKQVGFDYVQLHGNETPESIGRLAGRAYKVLRPASHEEAVQLAATYAHLGTKDGPTWLIDAYDAAAWGGTGQRADWSTAAQLARRYPGLLLAGGLTPANVAEAVRTVQPWGVDVASGVEARPGVKDHAKVRAFIQQVKGERWKS